MRVVVQCALARAKPTTVNNWLRLEFEHKWLWRGRTLTNRRLSLSEDVSVVRALSRWRCRVSAAAFKLRPTWAAKTLRTPTTPFDRSICSRVFQRRRRMQTPPGRRLRRPATTELLRSLSELRRRLSELR